MKRGKLITLLVVIVATMFFVATTALAQEKPETAEKPASEDTKTEEKKEKPKFKEYSEVITEKAVTKEGVFVTHQVEDKVYFEIPEAQLGKEFIWVTQLSKTQTGFGYSGAEVTTNTVKWNRRNDTIMLNKVEYQLRADSGTSEEIAVKASSLEQILFSFKIVTFAEDKSPVIEVTPLFLGDIDEMSPKRVLNAASMNKSKSFVNSVKAFPTNIETRVTATFKIKPPTPGQRRAGGSRATNATVELHHSMVALPENPMRSRIYDDRVGFFAGGFENYSADEHGVKTTQYISRWRLEKKDPSAKTSEPVKPITWYVGRGVPEKWKKYVKEGIELWQPVFEKAGFKNGIVGIIAPTVEEDPDWDAEDARFATIRWLPSTIQNAFGPHVRDPRSGEILEADVRIYHNVMKLARNWYFVQASPMDIRAQDLPLPDELMGELLRYIVAHEVGHSLGMRHNKLASSTYSIDQLRDPEFTKKYGTEASIMDYGRFNFITQPGDGAALIPIVGPYDYFAIEWAYTEFAGTKTPEEDKAELDKIAARQLKNPFLRFHKGDEGDETYRSDPGSQSEDLGDDAIEATRLGLLNLERVSSYMVKATSEKGEDYTELKAMYGAMLGQMNREFGHVAHIVGGIHRENKVYGQDAEIFTPVTADRQRKAVAFLLDKAFNVQSFLIREDIYQRVGHHGITTQILSGQSGLLRKLFDANRLRRMADLEATGNDGYTVADLMEQLTEGLFAELSDNQPKVNVFRRNLQRDFVAKLITMVFDEKAKEGDHKAAALGVLKALERKLDETRSSDKMTKYHLLDLKQTIASAFDAD